MAPENDIGWLIKLRYFQNIQNNIAIGLLSSLNWTTNDTGAFIALLSGLIYMTVKEPLLVTVMLSLALFFYCLNRVISYIPYLNLYVKRKIHFWQITGVIIGLTATLTVFEMPAQAIFLSGLEQFLTNIAQQSSTGGTSAIDPQAITLVFNAIRGVFLLLVGIAALFAYNQAQQGNDWRPIATQAGLAIGIILTVDVITFLFVGDGTGAGGGAGGGGGTAPGG
ncbi:hypothetical protein RIVM261_048110 [Rivularia sp. IAM M-261]|nr:hypothetical protein RIVM261_048110 [Rivularia sp. IAM M-261]